MLSADVKSQNCDHLVRGIVLDQHDTTILAFANIIIEGTGQGVQADSSGYYELKGLCPGTYTFICSHVDCEPIKRRIKIEDKITECNFYPEHHAKELEQVIIKSRTGQESTISKDQLDQETLASFKTSSLSRNLTNIAGISTLKTGSNIEKPIIHGLYGSRIAIIQQNSKLEDQQWGNEHAPNIDVLMFDKIEVVKGAASVRYGAKAIGGAVLLEQSKLYTGNKLKGSFIGNIQSNAPGASIGLVLKKGIKKYSGLGWKFATGIQKFGDQSAPDYVMSNSGLENVNASFSIGKDLGKWTNRITISSRYNNSGLLLASQVSSLKDIERALSADIPAIIRPFTFAIDAPRQQTLHSVAIYNGGVRLNEAHNLKYNISYQFNNRKEFDVRRSGRTDIPAVNMNLHTLEMDLTEDHRWNEHVSGSVGVTFMSQQNINIDNTQRRPIIPYYSLINPGIFVFEQAGFNDWTLEGGARMDFLALRSKYYNTQKQLNAPERQFTNGLFSAGVSRSIKDIITVRGNAGMGFRAPDVNELYSDGVHLSASAYEVGDPNLKSERSFKLIVEIENSKDRLFHYELNIFRQSFSNYIYQKKDGFVSTIAGLKLKYIYLQDDALFQGFDLNMDLNAGNFISLKSRTSYVHATNKATNKGIPLIAPFSTNLDVSLHLLKKVENLPLFDLIISGDYSAAQKRFDEDDLFKAPPASYILFDVGIRYSGRTRNNSIELKCNNILNQTYSNYLNNLRYFSPQEAGRNITLQYSFNF